MEIIIIIGIALAIAFVLYRNTSKTTEAVEVTPEVAPAPVSVVDVVAEEVVAEAPVKKTRKPRAPKAETASVKKSVAKAKASAKKPTKSKKS
jgi:BRCT domain type II-containing protein